MSGFHAGARQSAGPNPQFTDVVGTSILAGDLAKRHRGIMIEHHSDGVSQERVDRDCEEAGHRAGLSVPLSGCRTSRNDRF